MSDGNTIQAHKQAATEFLQLVTDGRIDEAYDKYIDMRGRHHNPYFAAGFPALKKGMIENRDQFPNKHHSIKHVLGDGDLVAVHSHVVLNPGDPGFATVHLFRFLGDRIVEMWDCGQAVPADLPNEDGMF